MIYQIIVKGAVQGVGYRPFILKRADSYGLRGYVKNIGAAVEILAIGDQKNLDLFSDGLYNEYPPGAFILSVEKKVVKDNDSKVDSGYSDFRIINSSVCDLSTELPVFLPDIGICDECLNELLDEKDRRYHYPLISCASCGPRFSILNRLPYDRETTTMDEFKMCPSCSKEYMYGRRHHAQTISCFDCGPQMLLDCYEKDADNISKHYEKKAAIKKAIELLEKDKIIGVKGVAGYQFVCKPLDETALRLRLIKWRENKPFAVMFKDYKEIENYCFINSDEKLLLESSARPIVLLKCKKSFPYEVCKDSSYIGAFLPSTGVHKLLCDALGPLIVTSANISDEPIIIDDEKFKNSFFEQRSDRSVDGVLFHKRKINIPLDDSVFAVTKLNSGRALKTFIRRARGYTPLPIILKNCNDLNVLSLGGDLKSTFSIAKKDRVIVSQYIGDLKEYYSLNNYKNLIYDYLRLFSFKPQLVVCDKHPMYESVKYASQYGLSNELQVLNVQHHHAHVLSVMAENSLESCIGVAIDGTGYGDDGNIWGGEFFYCNKTNYERVGHLSYIKLCGGDNAPKSAKMVKQCYYYALGLTDKEMPAVVEGALKNNINTFYTSSVGRLFDAVSALLDIKYENTFEGECAILLEKKASEYTEGLRPELSIDVSNDGILDQLKLFKDILGSYKSGLYSVEAISFSFHEALAKGIVRLCNKLRKEKNENSVCLSGGVFSNRLILKMSVEELLLNKFDVYVNKEVPAGDAGISLGQAYYGLMYTKK